MDLNGDGHRDILSGSYSRTGADSMAGLFHVLRGRPDGTFQKAETLTGTDGQPLIIPADEDSLTEKICTRPFAVDWDSDGDLDLVVGNFAGTFYLFQGEGDGRFLPEPEQLMSGGEPLQLAAQVIEDGASTTLRRAAHSDPFVIDWDGDGDLDLLSGASTGGVQWAENTAGPGKPPQLAAFQHLIEPGPPLEYGQLLTADDLTAPARATRIWVADVNADGRLDLLVGDTVTLISPADGLTPDEYHEKFAAWQKARDTAAEALNSTADDQPEPEALERYREIYQQRQEFMNEEWTGFVWLYVQK